MLSARRRVLLSVLGLFLISFPIQAEEQGARAYDSIEDYTVERLEGWKILVNKTLYHAEHAELRREALRHLQDHLYRITRVVPPEPLAKLREIPIWVERAHPRHPCMCYHVSADWLRQHAMNPAKAKAVELANCKTFLTWTREQPWMVLHELAHGYHDRVLGYDHAEVKACYEQAVAGARYRSVLHFDGRKVQHYALNNAQEYFAEGTEAFFGTNDFYPFVRAELRDFDPRLHALLEKIWQVPSANK